MAMKDCEYGDFPPIPAGMKRIYNVKTYPCPNGCAGSMYFAGPNGSIECDTDGHSENRGKMRCPKCGQYFTRVKPVEFAYRDIDEATFRSAMA